MTQDHRKAIRMKCVVPIESKAGTAFENIHAIDLSKGGIGFISSQEIAVDEQIAVEIDKTEVGEPVVVMGQVKWVERLQDSGHYRVGMKFVNRL